MYRESLSPSASVGCHGSFCTCSHTLSTGRVVNVCKDYKLKKGQSDINFIIRRQTQGFVLYSCTLLVVELTQWGYQLCLHPQSRLENSGAGASLSIVSDALCAQTAVIVAVTKVFTPIYFLTGLFALLDGHAQHFQPIFYPVHQTKYTQGECSRTHILDVGPWGSLCGTVI